MKKDTPRPNRTRASASITAQTCSALSAQYPVVGELHYGVHPYMQKQRIRQLHKQLYPCVGRRHSHRPDRALALPRLDHTHHLRSNRALLCTIFRLSSE